MGQEEIYQFLKSKEKRWWTAREIADSSKLHLHMVSGSLRKLRNNYPDYIKFRKNKDKKYEYKLIK